MTYLDTMYILKHIIAFFLLLVQLMCLVACRTTPAFSSWVSTWLHHLAKLVPLTRVLEETIMIGTFYENLLKRCAYSR